jgi:uroporphyrinogen-III synthase
MELARELGFDPVGAPMIEMKKVSGNEFRSFLVALSNRSIYVCLVMSENVIKFAIENADAYVPKDRFLSQLSHCQVIAVGDQTAESLRKEGLEPADVPEVVTIKGLVTYLSSQYDLVGRRVEILTSSKGSKMLAERLIDMGVEVHVLPLYSIELPEDLSESKKLIQMAIRREIDIFAFTSGRTVTHFLEIANELGVREKVIDILNDKIVAAMNHSTKKRLEAEGIGVMITPKNPSLDNLLATIGLGLGIAPPEP